ncbi:MAG: hypothetical protein ABL933_05725 [Methyloglobulus sp.]
MTSIDNTVCEALASDAKKVVSCFRDLKFNTACRNDPKTELECYRQAASKILVEQEAQENAQQQADTAAKELAEKKAYSYRSRMSPGALSPYRKEAYPKLFAEFGSRINEIENFKKKAAEMALDSGKCDFVEYVDMSIENSTLEHLKFWVDCSNKQRIRLDENQLKSSGKVLTEAEKSWSEADALSTCQNAIKNNASFPSVVDMHSLTGTSVRKADITNYVIVNIDFDAKNGLGMELPYKAECVFAPGEQGALNILQR